ncbi:MAG: hypothetical protein V3T31_04165, partial [candidate division Zixibacteria bacterium]
SLYFQKIFSLWLVYGAAIVLAGIVSVGTATAAFGFYKIEQVWLLAEALLALFVWLSITGLVGILSGSYAMPVMTTVAVWITQSLLAKREALQLLIDNEAVIKAIDIFYYIMPKFTEQGDLAIKLVWSRTGFDGMSVWSSLLYCMPAWSSLLFGSVMLILAMVALKRKDY